MDCSPPGSAVHGIFQARVLEWFAMAFSATAHSCCVFFIILFIVCPSSLPSSVPSSVPYTLILLGSQRPEMARSSQRLPLFMLPFAAPSPPPRGSYNFQWLRQPVHVLSPYSRQGARGKLWVHGAQTLSFKMALVLPPHRISHIRAPTVHCHVCTSDVIFRFPSRTSSVNSSHPMSHLTLSINFSKLDAVHQIVTSDVTSGVMCQVLTFPVVSQILKSEVLCQVCASDVIPWVQTSHI